MRPRMAFFAQRAEVLLTVVAAFSKRQDVVDFLGFPVDSMRLALLAERVSVDVSVADALPSPAVASFCGWIASVLLVSLVFLFLVLRAKAPIGEVGAAGMGARSFGFPWHVVAPNEKPPGNRSHGGSVRNFLRYHYIRVFSKKRPRYWTSRLAEEKHRELLERTVLLLVRRGAFDVEPLADAVYRAGGVAALGVEGLQHVPLVV